MPVQVMCKFHKDKIRSKQAMLRTRSNIVVFALKASNSKVNSAIWQEFKLVQYFMPVQDMCTFLRYPINIKQFMLRTRSSMVFVRHLRASNSELNSLIRSEFEIIQYFMHVLVTCKFDQNLIKSEDFILKTTFSHYKSLQKK